MCVFMLPAFLIPPFLLFLIQHPHLEPLQTPCAPFSPLTGSDSMRTLGNICHVSLPIDAVRHGIHNDTGCSVELSFPFTKLLQPPKTTKTMQFLMHMYGFCDLIILTNHSKMCKVKSHQSSCVLALQPN